MKTVNLIGLRETAAIMYIGNATSTWNYNQFLREIDDAFCNYDDNYIFWTNRTRTIKYWLWR